jgi:hypothetical protein
MASRSEMQGADGTRDDVDARARKLGHAMAWQLGPNSRRRGHAYHWLGTCNQCGAEASAAAGSSSGGIRDARKVPCSGPGTAVLTEIESAHVSQQVAGAVRQFGRDVRRNQTRDRRRRAR